MEYRHITEVDFDLKLSKIIGLDIETTGVNPRRDNILLIQIASLDITYVFDVRLLPEPYIKWLLDYISDFTIVGHNLKFDLSFLYTKYGFKSSGKLFDTMLAEELLTAGKSIDYNDDDLVFNDKGKVERYSLKAIAFKYLNIILDKSIRRDFLDITIKEMSKEQIEYAAKDAAILLDLYGALSRRLEEFKITQVARLEFNLIPVLVVMECTGIRFDVGLIEPALKELEAEAAECTEAIYGILGKEINLNSPKQLLAAFQSVGVNITSTNVETLSRVNHPLAVKILQYRKAFKAISSFGQTLISKIEEDGRIHCEYRQLGAATGRFSSANPNLQQIPHKPVFRNPFKGAPGTLLITADYSQMELRYGAWIAQEQAMLEEYSKEDADLHILTASKIFGKPREEVTKEERSHGKTGNFSVMYGTSPKGLAAKQGISLELAQRIVSGFWKAYPGLQRIINAAAEEAIKHGFVRTKLGRIRFFDMPVSTDPRFQFKLGEIRRAAGNFIIQGGCADVTKYALVLIHKHLPEGCKILMQVHDEVVVEAPEELAEEVSRIVKTNMELAAKTILGWTIPVEVLIGESWKK